MTIKITTENIFVSPEEQNNPSHNFKPIPLHPEETIHPKAIRVTTNNIFSPLSEKKPTYNFNTLCLQIADEIDDTTNEYDREIKDAIYHAIHIGSYEKFWFNTKENIELSGEQELWLTHAFYFLKARAKYELYKNILKDQALSSRCFTDFQEERECLRAETSRKIELKTGISLIKSTQF